MIGLKVERMKKGLTQDDLARKVGIKPGLISKYERGERVPRLGTVVKIAKVLGVKVDDLL